MSVTAAVNIPDRLPPCHVTPALRRGGSKNGVPVHTRSMGKRASFSDEHTKPQDSEDEIPPIGSIAQFMHERIDFGFHPRLKDGRRHCLGYRKVFTGHAITDWIGAQPWCHKPNLQSADREVAIKVGQMLVQAGLLQPVTHESRFGDDPLFYQLSTATSPSSSIKVPLHSNEEYDYDLVIIGAGSAGLAAAQFALHLGIKVLLLDQKSAFGGDAIWKACVPSKALKSVAKIVNNMKRACEFKMGNDKPKADMKRVFSYLRDQRDAAHKGKHQSPNEVRGDGADVMTGRVLFMDAQTVEVKDEYGLHNIRGRFFLVATGAKPAEPNIPEIEYVSYYTYDTIFDLQELPNRLVVVGAGPQGCEMAQAFCRLGANVKLVGPQLLPKEEDWVQEQVQKRFEEEGVEFVKGHVVGVQQQTLDGQKKITVTLEHVEVECDVLLICVGRTPAVKGLNLEAAGVVFGDRGIKVSECLNTTRRHIYAIGDCADSPIPAQQTHYGVWQAMQAIRNMFFPSTDVGTSTLLPRVTYMSPEIAHVGMSHVEAKKQFGDYYRAVVHKNHDNGRAIADDDREGCMELLVHDDGRLLGATIVSEHASELISELALAINQKLHIGDLAYCTHPTTTYSFAVMQVAQKVHHAPVAFPYITSSATVSVIRTLFYVLPTTYKRHPGG